MLIVTNRNINQDRYENGVADEFAFGEQVNTKGPNEIRLAHAKKVKTGANAGDWHIKLVKEPRNLTAENLPSKHEFAALRKRLQKANKNCVFFIHGYNQSFQKNLEQSLLIEELYDVEVVAFSWPANTGGFTTREYRDANRTAQASVAALDATLMKLGAYHCGPFDREAQESCDVKLSLMAYSLGNFLLQNYVRDALYENDANIFANIILCQADVDHPGHQYWIDAIETGKRIYITINENDWVLKWSDSNFQKDRLGRTARGLIAKKPNYYDFTDGPGVERTHGLFYADTNATIKTFFKTVLNGHRPDDSLDLYYDDINNSWRF